MECNCTHNFTCRACCLNAKPYHFTTTDWPELPVSVRQFAAGALADAAVEGKRCKTVISSTSRSSKCCTNIAPEDSDYCERCFHCNPQGS